MMSESGQFDRLAQELSLGERKSLLDRLEGHSIISKEPLYQEEAGTAPGDAESRFAKLPWYRRVFFMIMGIFKSRPPVEFFQEFEVGRLGRLLEQKAPAIFNASRGLLLPEFYHAVTRLRDCSRFFYNALDAGFNRDKGGFYVFLGSLEMPDVHARLVEGTDPERISGLNPAITESALRQAALHGMEDILGTVSEEQRLRIYTIARQLACLKQLSSFLYDRLLLAFAQDDALGGMVCSAGVIRDALFSLNNVLYSLKEIPSMTLLGSLFVFILQDRAEEEGFDMNGETKKLLTQAETAIAVIRSFNRQTHLTSLARIAARNVGLGPEPISGGEDWFMLYREHWRRDVDDRLFRFFSQRRHRELQKTCRDFFQGAAPAKLEHYGAVPDQPEGMGSPGADCLGFLLSFAGQVFLRELHPVLKVVLAEGEFSRPENRLEFDEAYASIFKLDEAIRKFDESLGPKGELGMRYAQVSGEMSSLPARRRKIQLLTEECAEGARAIIERAAWAIGTLAQVTGGLAVDGKPAARAAEGRYGMLINLEKLEEKNSGLTAGIKAAADRLTQARDILAGIDVLESGRQRG